MNRDSIHTLMSSVRQARMRIAILVSACVIATAGVQGYADDSQIIPFRLGTGGSAGTYFPIGTLLAQALSSRADEPRDDGKGQANLLMLAQRSSGSVTNVKEIGSGLLESGLVQADVAHWAYKGAGPFADSPPLRNLRSIASLYLESLHLVAHPDSNIKDVSDLAGKRVSVDEFGSGTLFDVRPILLSHGLVETDVKMVYLKASDAMDRLQNRQLDAFFIVAGYPVAGLANLVESGSATIIPISGQPINQILDDYPFFTRDHIPANIYGNPEPVSTLAVAAQWVVDASIDEDLVYRITKNLWQPETINTLIQGHPKGHEINLASALTGISLPLHAGSERFYREAGIAIAPTQRQLKDTQTTPPSNEVAE